MYDIDYVFDEMSLFHIEELFNILVLSNPPHSSSTSSEITTELIPSKLNLGVFKWPVPALMFQNLKWSLPSTKSNFMLNDLKKKYGEDINLITWYFLKYNTGSFTKEHVHSAYIPNWSTITMLSDPDEYTGGELVIHTRDNEEEIILEKGQTIKLNWNIAHSVREVKSGERKTLVHWLK